MAPLLRNIRSQAKVTTLAAVFLLSFTLYGLYCISTVNEVKVNGPIYQDIERSQDVIADVLPPPEYLVETMLIAYQLLEAGDPGEIESLSDRGERLQSEYSVRHEYWERTLPPGSLRSALVDSSYLPAQRIQEALTKRFLPAIRAGDKVAARAVLDKEIRPEYQRHRERIDAVVSLAKSRNLQAEAGAAMAVRSRTYGQIVIGILLFAFLSFFSSYAISEERKSAEASKEGSEDAVLSRAGTRG
jgi:methyl-accepting chemotaxis protein